METLAVCVQFSKAQALRSDLENVQIWDKTRRLQKVDAQTVAIPVRCTRADLLHHLAAWPDATISNHILPPSKCSLFQTPFQKLTAAMSSLLKMKCISEGLLEELPQKWEQHGDLIIIPPGAFASPQWSDFGEDLWAVVADSLSCKRIARYSSIADNGFRSSQVILLFGDDGKVIHKDNDIQYSYDVTKCMFSAGNITEKLRVAQFDCHGQVVVDLYAGIGYFTLPYLVHAQAEHVHACEWNPDAVAALRENLSLNGVTERCTIHEGDNRELCLEDLADRVNLGLIPSSEEGWPIAVKVLKPSGGLLHVHGNVTNSSQSTACGKIPDNVDVDAHSLLSASQSEEYQVRESTDGATAIASKRISKEHINSKAISPCIVQWAASAANQINNLLEDMKGGKWTTLVVHIEKVKSYAPHIDHVVVDLHCRPLS